MSKKFKLTFHTTVEVNPEEVVEALRAFEKACDGAANDVADEEVAPKKAAKKAKPAPENFDEDEEDGDEDKPADEEVDETEEADGGDGAEDDGDDEDKAPPTTKKGKGLSVEDVNDACKKKVHALIDRGVSGADARTQVLTILQKKFKVKSVSNLKKEFYEAAIAAMK